MSDELLPIPERDNFASESPIRAFADWNESGMYAIGKGFRPSIQHLPVYLNALESREGWILVQIMYADNPERLSMVFRYDL